MTMMETDDSFPRGGDRRRTDTNSGIEQEQDNGKRLSSKKRKSTESNASGTHTESSSDIKTDFLFGGSKLKKGEDDKKSSKRRKKTDAASVSASSPSKHSLLPLGGGGVVMSTKTHKKKASSSTTKSTESVMTTTTPVIEALSFSKLAKGTKVLACVREVQDEFAIVSLPNLLTAYILPQPNFPLRNTLTVGQTLAVVVQKIATEQVKGGASRRRIQVSPLPQAINPRGLLIGENDVQPRDNVKELSIANAANRLARASMTVRGQILSIEDHGCVVDLGFGARGFVKFEDVQDGENFVILDEDDDTGNDDEKECHEDEENGNDEKESPAVLQIGRMYDFMVIPVTTSSSAKDPSMTVFPLKLPSAGSFANQHVSSLSAISSPGRRQPLKDSASPLTLASLTPGWLVEVKVEALATNGLCVSFFDNVFRGAMELNHLGATLIPEVKDGAAVTGPVAGWKQLASSIFHSHQHFYARILAVDVPTKLVRLSAAPHVLHYRNMADFTSPLSGFPSLGSVVPNCTVIKVDPGIGALLALPPEYNYMDQKEALLSKTLVQSSKLFSNEKFQQACYVRKVYVHISKAMDDADEGDAKEAAVVGKFHREFAPCTKHSVRILSTGHWMEGVAAGGCSPAILEAHVLSHDDLVPGKVYKQVPVRAHLPGGSVLVYLGGMTRKGTKDKKSLSTPGISGLIPPQQLFDTTSSGTSEYRKRVVQAKYGVDAKVDVRVLWVDPARKRCLVTAKKSIVQAPPERIVTSYSDIRIGQVAVGYISRIDDQSLYVTFCNKVYGRVTARSLATELGVSDHKESFNVGDVVTCRVVTLRRSIPREQVMSNANDMDERDINPNLIRREYWELTLSLKAKSEERAEEIPGGGHEIDIVHPEPIQLRTGAILPQKSMKIVQLVDGKPRQSGCFVPGYALVRIKSKYVLANKSLEKSGITDTIECKLPYSQLMDSYDPSDIRSVEAMNDMAHRLLMVGKKINQKGIVLVDPNKSNVEYSSGIGRLPIVSIRRDLVGVKEKQDETNDLDGKRPFVPSSSSDLFAGALLLGFVTQIDPRHGGFVRFLDGMTGLITKKQGGDRLPLYNTVQTRVKVIDNSFKPHRILLELDSCHKKLPHNDQSLSSIKIGDKLTKATVTKIGFQEVHLTVDDVIADRQRYIIHCTCKSSKTYVVNRSKNSRRGNTVPRVDKHHPFYGIVKGQELHGLTVVALNHRKGIVDVFLTDKEVSDKGKLEQQRAPIVVEKHSQLVNGMRTTCVVVGHAKGNKGLFVQVGPSVRGFVRGLDVSSDLDVLNDLPSSVPLGAVLDCVVVDQKQWLNNRLSCPLPSFYQKYLKKRLIKRNCDDDTLFLSLHGLGPCPPKPAEGELVIGRINKTLPQIQAPSLMLDLRGGFVGRCCITELEEPDQWENMPLGNSMIAKGGHGRGEPHGDENVCSKNDHDHADIHQEHDESRSQGNKAYADEKYVECRIVNVDLMKNRIDVSLRRSRIQGDLDDDPSPQTGEVVQAFVVTTNKNGCFVRLSKDVDGRSTIKELCDGFLPKPEASFPPGRLVVGKVKDIRSHDMRVQVDLDMRESVLLKEQQNRLSFADIIVGQKYKGSVQRVEDYGVFVRIENSSLSGLTHVSECSDGFIRNLPSLYNPGDLVKVLVIKKVDDGEKLAFSMKASHFRDDDDSTSSSTHTDLMDDEDDDVVDMKHIHKQYERHDEKTEGLDSDDGDLASRLAGRLDSGEGPNDRELDSKLSGSGTRNASGSSESSRSSSSEEEDDTREETFLDTDVGFSWGANALTFVRSQGVRRQDEEPDSSDESEVDSEDDAHNGNIPSKSHKSRRRQAEKRRGEREISRREVALADGTADDNPETADDFDRLLAGDPNNSELWIRYMAYYLSLADVPSARKIADKALERIEFRREREKLNVWSAVLKLEYKYGSEETFKGAIDRACMQNNSKKVYLRTCEILEEGLKTSSRDPSIVSLADNVFSTMCKKHRSKKKVWLAYMQYLLRQSRHEEAHALMKRAMLSLAPYKHTETMSRFAQMEFELGSHERGRTIFDGLLLKNAKRLDLFFVYMDKELKHGNIEYARAMLKRKAEERKLSDKQMKSLFKKWYKIEEAYGTEESQEHVKEAARKYVLSSRN